MNTEMQTKSFPTRLFKGHQMRGQGGFPEEMGFKLKAGVSAMHTAVSARPWSGNHGRGCDRAAQARERHTDWLGLGRTWQNGAIKGF